MNAMTKTWTRRRASEKAARLLAGSLLTGALLIGSIPANAQDTTQASQERKGGKAGEQTATLPLVSCWYKGEVLYYIRIDTSDRATAQQQGLNYVPQLANVLTSSPAAYDDIYTVTNFKQFNVVPSAPDPVGPNSSDHNYQPLWQVSEVTWNRGSKARTLKSEEAIKAAAQSGEVTITKTNVVINCPIVFRPGYGRLPNTEIEFGDKDRRHHDEDSNN